MYYVVCCNVSFSASSLLSTEPCSLSAAAKGLAAASTRGPTRHFTHARTFGWQQQQQQQQQQSSRVIE